MRQYIIVVSFLLSGFISCQSSQESDGDGYIDVLKELSEEVLKDRLHEIECGQTSKYFGGTLTYSPKYKGLLSLSVNGLNLRFELSNKAVLARFKDIEIKIRFLSKTGSVIWEEKLIVYEFIDPRGKLKLEKEISCTNQQYEDISSFESEIVKASCDKS